MSPIWRDIVDPEFLGALADAGGSMPMQQHPTYGKVLSRLGRKVSYALWKVAGQPVAMAQVASRPGLAVMLRGPLFLDPRRADSAALLCSVAGFRGLTIATPEFPVSGRGLVPLLTGRHDAIWRLRGNAKDLRAGLASKWRNALTRAEIVGKGLTIRASASADAGWLYAAEMAQRRARGYRALPPEFADLWRAAQPGGFRLYEARANGRRVAGVVVLMHRPWASYHIAWSGEEGRRLNANRLLLWRAACDLQDEGFTALCLGDVNTEDAPGLASFKIGTGAEVRALGGTLLVLPAIRRRS